MKKYLFIDTETTGFPKGEPLVQNGQARVCQVAMMVTDHDGKELTTFSTLIKPSNWEISSGAQRCHGISQEDCEKFGMYQDNVMAAYYDILSNVDFVIAHNKNFDKKMMDIEAAYYAANDEPQVPWYCTMEASTEICMIPPTKRMAASGRNHYKSPNLGEAYKHFTGKDLVGAHDALVDTRACKEIFFSLKEIHSV